MFLGLTSDIDRAEILRLVEAQDTAELLSRMHRLTVSRHDTVFVPHGLLHAIGPGVLLAEVQEPEDLSILLEWTGFDLDGETHGHLGLGFDLALKAVETTSRSEHDIAALVDRAGGNGPALVSASEPFFRLDRVRHDAVLDAGLSILIALEGAMRLTMTFGASEELRAGTTVLIPYSAGVAHLTGSGTVLVARPPRP